MKYAIETIIKGKEYKIQFTTLPTVKENFRGILKLKTNYPEKPQITISIYGRFGQTNNPGKPFSQGIKSSRKTDNTIKAPIFVSSRYIRLVGKTGAETSEVAEVHTKRNRPLNLTVADFTLKDKMQYTIETLEKDKRYKITFATIPGVNRNYNGILKLKTNYPDMPAITFVIHGRFPKKAYNDR